MENGTSAVKHFSSKWSTSIMNQLQENRIFREVKGSIEEQIW